MSRSKYRNLIIVGNGFDCWQSIPTSYEAFRLYYSKHVEEVAKALGYGIYTVTDKSGAKKNITAVELIYGNPFEPNYLENEFFWNLEARMDRLDDQKINFFFGRSAEGREKLRKTVDEAITLLRRLFCDWVETFNIKKENSGFRFSDDSFIVNFNYTDTLEKRFGVNPNNDFHIHGVATDPSSIVVGHSTHPEMPLKELIEQHFIKPEDPAKGLPRFEGLYAVEEALYRTDKHTADRIDEFCVSLMKNGVHIEDIENIYVLGHSLAPADMDYFSFINAITRCGCNYEDLSAVGHMNQDFLAPLNDERLLGWIILNVQYATAHRGRIDPNAEDIFAFLDDGRNDKMPYSEYAAKCAVTQRFWLEQARRTQDILENLERRCGAQIPEGCHSILSYMDYIDYGHDQRKRNATWHISCYSDADRKRARKVMKELRIKNYSLHSSISDCIADFAV